MRQNYKLFAISVKIKNALFSFFIRQTTLHEWGNWFLFLFTLLYYFIFLKNRQKMKNTFVKKKGFEKDH